MSVIETLARVAIEAACLGLCDRFAQLAALTLPPFTPANAALAVEAVSSRLSKPEPLLGLSALLEKFAEITCNTALLCFELAGWDLFAWNSASGRLQRAHSSSPFSSSHPLLSLPHAVCSYEKLSLRMRAKCFLNLNRDSVCAVAWREPGGAVRFQDVKELPRDQPPGGELAFRGVYDTAIDRLLGLALAPMAAKAGRLVLLAVDVSCASGGVVRPVRLATLAAEIRRASGPRRVVAVFNRESGTFVTIRF